MKWKLTIHFNWYWFQPNVTICQKEDCHGVCSYCTPHVLHQSEGDSEYPEEQKCPCHLYQRKRERNCYLFLKLVIRISILIDKGKEFHFSCNINLKPFIPNQLSQTIYLKHRRLAIYFFLSNRKSLATTWLYLHISGTEVTDRLVIPNILTFTTMLYTFNENYIM